MKKAEEYLPPILGREDSDFESPLAVEMRRLYTKLRPRLRRENLSVLMVTSAERGEGKSTTSSNLAVTIARHKHTKTVLVDGDLRRPSIHTVLGMDRDHGFSDVLAGDASLDSVIKDTAHEDLKVITCGSRFESPAALFESRNLTRVLGELRSRFDLVIIDAPPVLPVADSQLMAQEVDGVVMVVMAGLTPREVVQRGQSVLRDSRANLLGIVLNNAGEVLPYYYDHSYYGYD